MSLRVGCSAVGVVLTFFRGLVFCCLLVILFGYFSWFDCFFVWGGLLCCFIVLVIYVW